MISLKLITPVSQIKDKINESLSIQMNKILRSKQSFITKELQDSINGWILEQPEIISLLSSNPNSLAGQFGIPSGMVNSAVESIIYSIKNSIRIDFQPFDKKLKGSFNINVQPDDFQDILSLGTGHVNYKDGDLHWLDWLITLGSSIIVANYHYQPSGGRGRSGLGFMSVGQSFRVSPSFSGTIDNNFITRALRGRESYISSILHKVFS